MIMGRGKGKGKKLTVNSHDDNGSGEEEKIPSQKRRGRPLKPLKDEIDHEDEAERLEEEDSENGKSSIATKPVKTSSTAIENGKKRKRNWQARDKTDPVKEENDNSTRSLSDDSLKSNGFRQNRSRRKSKPRRAAEVGVECR